MTAPQGGGPLRFASFLAPNMLPVYWFLAARIGERLGRPVELVVGSSFDQFEAGDADLGVICGLPYVWLADRHPAPVEPLAAPVLDGDRYGGRPVYFSDVIVRRDSPITRLEELRGRSWAYNEPASHSGHTVTLYTLVRMGARPGFLGPVLQAGYHQRAIRLVAAGTVDAAAIDSQVLAIELRDHPRLADGLRVIGAFGPSTIQPVVAASRLPDRLKDQVRELLVDLGDDPSARAALDHGFIRRFAPVDDAAYDDIRGMQATIEAAGWTSLSHTGGEAADRQRQGPSQGAIVRDVPEVLFVCVHNAGRSQMAAALLDHHAQGRVQVRSAGSDPADRINPAVVAAMGEWGIDLSRELPKPLTDESVKAADVVVTMGCGDACPIYPGRRYEDWELPDPAGQPVEVVRRIRDDIDLRVRRLLADLQ
jgi:phosphonate transport system substrate-binding protein